MRDYGLPDVIVIPNDAGPNDNRIVIDPISGDIEIYEGANLVGRFTASDPSGSEPGIFIFEPGNEANYISIQLVGGIPNIIFGTDDPDQGITAPGQILHFVDFVGATRLFSTIIDTANFTGQSSGTLEIFSETLDGSAQPHITFENQELTLGTNAKFESQADGAVISADGVTDMVLNNVPRILIGREYEVQIHTEITMVTTATTDRWILEAREGGVVFDRFANLMPLVVGTHQLSIDSTVDWVATTTLPDFDVFANEIAGAATIQLRASATSKRWMKVKDSGRIP